MYNERPTGRLTISFSQLKDEENSALQKSTKLPHARVDSGTSTISGDVVTQKDPSKSLAQWSVSSVELNETRQATLLNIQPFSEDKQWVQSKLSIGQPVIPIPIFMPGPVIVPGWETVPSGTHTTTSKPSSPASFSLKVTTATLIHSVVPRSSP